MVLDEVGFSHFSTAQSEREVHSERLIQGSARFTNKSYIETNHE